MQLRKEHIAPFHEFIVVLTKGEHTYRVDRGGDGPVLDTVKKQGVPSRDVVALLQLSSWKELDRTSYCMLDLSWGSDTTLDLKLVLDTCFQIHNESGKRYKLLTHNCYFYAQTIIMVSVRKTVALRADFPVNEAPKGIITRKVYGSIGMELWPELGQEVGLELEPALGRVLGRVLGWEFERALGKGPEVGQKLEWKVWPAIWLELAQQLGQEMGDELAWELVQEVEWPELRRAREGRERERQEQLRLEQKWWEWQQQQQQREWEQEQLEQEQERNQEQDLDRKLERIGCLDWWRMRTQRQLWKQEQQARKEWQRKRKRQWLQDQRQDRQKRQRAKQQERWWEQLEEWREQEWGLLLSQLRGQLQKLEPMELALAWALELTQEVLVEVLKLALNGELEPNWHMKSSRLCTLPPKTFPSELTDLWYVKQHLCRCAAGYLL
jgi:hypothetical protein